MYTLIYSVGFKIQVSYFFHSIYFNILLSKSIALTPHPLNHVTVEHGWQQLYFPRAEKILRYYKVAAALSKGANNISFKHEIRRTVGVRYYERIYSAIIRPVETF